MTEQELIEQLTAHILPVINQFVEEKLDALRNVRVNAIPIGEKREMIILMNRLDPHEMDCTFFDEEETQA